MACAAETAWVIACNTLRKGVRSGEQCNKIRLAGHFVEEIMAALNLSYGRVTASISRGKASATLDVQPRGAVSAARQHCQLQTRGAGHQLLGATFHDRRPPGN